MNSAIKLMSLFLFLLLATSSLISLESVSAQSTHKPSVPEFSTKLIDYSDSKAIELTIMNQPFESYTDSGQIISLYYNVHFKLHNLDSWTAMYYCGDVFPTHSGSDIELVYPLQLSSSSSSYYLLKELAGYYYLLAEIPFNEQLDFRVQAMEGVLTPSAFNGQTSDWSSIQTIRISSIPTSPNPTPSPTNPETPWFIVILIIGTAFSVAIVLGFKLKKR
jgi:hypothetical protein